MANVSTHGPAARRPHGRTQRPSGRPGPPGHDGEKRGHRQPRDLPILTVTVNPALDVTTWVPMVEPGRKLRCGPPLYEPGGGGVNVSRAIHELGGKSRAFVALGGSAGEHYLQLLAPLGIDTEIWPIGGETRLSLTVMEEAAHRHYRFVLPGPPIGPDAAAALVAEVRRQVELTPGILVLSGSTLPGLPVDFAGRLAAHARDIGSRAIVDVSGPPLRAALEHRPFLVRMNHIEAHELVGATADDDAQLLRRTARQIVEQGGAENVIVTAGGAGAVLATADRLLHFRPPRVEVVSAVGAGDSFAGALALGLAKGWSLAEACRFGVAAAASAVTGRSTELCKRPQTLALLDGVTVEPEPVAG